MVEGTFVTILMAVTTIYALVGDNIRLFSTSQDADPYFFAGITLSLILFTLELLIQSCVVNEFKYSFFFWLDFIATISLILDVPWLTDFLSFILNLDMSYEEQDVKPGSIPITSET